MNCPVPKYHNKIITLSHGSGGQVTHNLIRDIFMKVFDNDLLSEQLDSAILKIDKGKLAFTTDSFVVNPIFFPGGNIGDLAVNGTVNDLLMCGAKPQFLSCAFILEEGFEISKLEEIVVTMKKAADKIGVKIVTGDTKVVERGKGDKIFINTSGIGIIPDHINLSPKNIKPGDKIILSGTIGDHGIAILSARENLNFQSEVKSDTAALVELVNRMFKVTNTIRAMRDPTRGGLATTLNEFTSGSDFGIVVDENKIKVNDDVNAICELLGFDPFYIANEGKLVCFVAPEDSQELLAEMKSDPLGIDSEIIGEVTKSNPGRVVLKTKIGTKRILEMLSGDQLPRIC